MRENSQRQQPTRKVVPKLQERTVRDSNQPGKLSPSYEREQSETATKKVKTRHKKKKHTHLTNNNRQTKICQKGMSTENNIGVQTRAMAQWVDNEANPEQVQKTMDQATTSTVELHRTKEDTIKEFI